MNKKRFLAFLIVAFLIIALASFGINGCTSSSDSSDDTTSGDTTGTGGDGGTSDTSGSTLPYAGTCLETLYKCVGDISGTTTCSFDTGTCTMTTTFSNGSYATLSYCDMMNGDLYSYYDSKGNMCFKISVDITDSNNPKTIFTAGNGDKYTLTMNTTTSVATVICPDGSTETYDFSGDDTDDGDTTDDGDYDDGVDTTADPSSCGASSIDIVNCIKSCGLSGSLEVEMMLERAKGAMDLSQKLSPR